MRSNNHNHSTFGRSSIAAALGVLVILAALWLTGAPVQHALAHGAADIAHGETGGSEEPSCVVCAVLAASPASDGRLPAVGPDPADPMSLPPLEPTEPRLGAALHGADLARAPPLPSPSASSSLTGRPRPT